MKIYYVANARMPNEKAHGIQIAKMCEAFIEAGIALELIIPARRTVPETLEAFYDLSVPIPTTRLPVLDGYRWGRMGYVISSFTFMISYLSFLLAKRMRGERFILYTIDIDTFASAALALLDQPLYTEMHVAHRWNLALAMLFRRTKGVIAINSIIISELRAKFPWVRYHAAPNGVDMSDFRARDRGEARRALGIPETGQIVLYAGRFLEWKGLEILPDAAAEFPSEAFLYLVGGTREEFEQVTGRSASKVMKFPGEQPHHRMPLWLAAANILLVIGTMRDTQSYWYTSPMKLFEYLAAGRSIVASDTPAIREIVSEQEVSFYKVDDARALATTVIQRLANSSTANEQERRALAKASDYSWEQRARGIIEFIRTTSPI